jgi:hypothetical protein
MRRRRVPGLPTTTASGGVVGPLRVTGSDSFVSAGGGDAGGA